MKILFVGFGNLGAQVFDLLALRAKKDDHILVGGRKLDSIRERIRWTAGAALQLGTPINVDATYLDVWNGDQTAHTIAAFKPDVIISSMTVLPSASIEHLPAPLFHKLAQARGGPWLPTTLVLVYKLMQAIKHTGLTPIVLNGGTPDNSHEILGKVGLAPTSGFGNLALTVPALRQVIAEQLHVPVEQVRVLFFAHSYVVQSLRVGTPGGAPFHVTVTVGGQEVTGQLDLPLLFRQLPLILEHEYTQLLTAASASTVLDALMLDSSQMVHAPGPNGLPGGYPFQKGMQGLEVVVPAGFTLEEAIRLNQEGQKRDGIEWVESDGTVYFTEENMALLKETLGYSCRRMPLSEVEERAKELKARYLQVLPR